MEQTERERVDSVCMQHDRGIDDLAPLTRTVKFHGKSLGLLLYKKDEDVRSSLNKGSTGLSPLKLEPALLVTLISSSQAWWRVEVEAISAEIAPRLDSGGI